MKLLVIFQHVALPMGIKRTYWIPIFIGLTDRIFSSKKFELRRFFRLQNLTSNMDIDKAKGIICSVLGRKERIDFSASAFRLVFH